jgi:large subunit ribosomal protein L9
LRSNWFIDSLPEVPEKIAAALQNVALTIATKVSATGTIFGSVGNAEVAKALEELGHNIDRKIIFVKGVKAVGKYTATIKLHKEVSVEIPFEVVSE